jgi:hypothetical protein
MTQLSEAGDRLKALAKTADMVAMIVKKLLPIVRFFAGPVLALLQFWVLWGVCNSYTALVARVIHSELSIMNVLPDLARATALTGLFLVIAGMLWSWVARIEGLQAITWFVVFATTATLSPLLIGSASGGPLMSLGFLIRLVLLAAITAALYLGSNVLRMFRGHLGSAQ